MSRSVAAQRYAIALFELAVQHGQVDQVREELSQVKRIFLENKELGTLLSLPKLTLGKKKEIITTLFSGANVLVLNTLYVLLDKKRIDETVAIIEEFNALADEAAGVAEATVYSTRPLTDEEKANISTSFAHKVGKNALRIENILDPSLIGGIRLEIGNRIYDSSISAKLERMRRELIGS